MANLTLPIGVSRPRPNFNPSPKTRFRSSGDNIKAHRDLMEQHAFDRALDFACLQYQTQAASRVQDANGALALGYKILGVQEFIATLKMLSEEPPQIVTEPPANLDHKA